MDDFKIRQAQEQQDKLARYSVLNQFVKKGILINGSSPMEQFSINELLMSNSMTKDADGGIKSRIYSGCVNFSQKLEKAGLGASYVYFFKRNLPAHDERGLHIERYNGEFLDKFCKNGESKFKWRSIVEIVYSG